MRPSELTGPCHSSRTARSSPSSSSGEALAARASRAELSSSSRTCGEPLGLLQGSGTLGGDVGVGVHRQLVEAQLQRGQPAAQLVGDVPDEVALALEQLGQRDGGGVEHVGHAVQLGDAVTVRRGPEVTRPEPGGPARDLLQRVGQASRGQGRDDRADGHREQHGREHQRGRLQLARAHLGGGLGEHGGTVEAEGQRLGDLGRGRWCRRSR